LKEEIGSDFLNVMETSSVTLSAVYDLVWESAF
jgi:hypothetical protein